MNSVWLAFLLILPLHSARAVGLVEKDGWKFSLSGFLELDMISDSTRSLPEVVGNTPVDRPDTVAGQNGRTQFSVRNTRLNFTLSAPVSGDWRAKGVLELDLLGFDPTPGAGSNTETSFFYSPTLRMRHAFFQADTEGWQVVAGQTWSLFGWQPFYFPSSASVPPLSGVSYIRPAQVRALRTFKLSDYNTLYAAVSVNRPPQRDAKYPALTGGARLALGERSSGLTAGGTGEQKTQPMSVAVSGTAREFAIPTANGGLSDLPGSAVALDAMLPVLASEDGHDVSGTLSLTGEFTEGRGYAEEFPGWTGNLSNPSAVPNLDGGQGEFDSAGVFHLVHLRTYNVHLQYHFNSAARTWLNAGYGQLYSDNIGELASPVTGKTSAGKFPHSRNESLFFNLFHDLTPQIRVAAEFSHYRTQYADGVLANDNRYQLSGWFLF